MEGVQIGLAGVCAGGERLAVPASFVVEEALNLSLPHWMRFARKRRAICNSICAWSVACNVDVHRERGIVAATSQDTHTHLLEALL